MTAYRIKQNGVVVVKVEGPDDYAEREVMRYAMQYSEDGPLVIERLNKDRWTVVKLVSEATITDRLKRLTQRLEIANSIGDNDAALISEALAYIQRLEQSLEDAGEDRRDD